MSESTKELNTSTAAAGRAQERVVMRDSFIRRAKAQLAEINQYLADVEHWNETRTQFEQIDPDPDGDMCRLSETLVRFLAGA